MEKLTTQVRNIWNRIKDAKYEVRCFFFPYNRVKIHNLPSTWTDRPVVMFHAVFQILVDFVELEHPFIMWGDDISGRHLNYDEMLVNLELKYSPVHNKPLEYEPGYYEKRYPPFKEILELYKWYKDKEYDKEFEDWELEKAHSTLCTEKMQRVVELRWYFWS